MIISFLFLIGGAFNVIQETGIIHFAIRRLTAALRSRPWLEKLLIPVMMIVFSLGGSIFGMGEETIPFILIFVPLKPSSAGGHRPGNRRRPPGRARTVRRNRGRSRLTGHLAVAAGRRESRAQRGS